MKSLERMLSLLGQTSLYNTDIKSTAAIELSEYAYFLDSMELEINDVLNNCFVETISPTGYSSYLKLYSLPDYIPKSLMKDIVKKRLAITNLDFTAEGIKKCLASGGLDVSLQENFVNNTVTVKILSDAGIFGTPKEREAFIKHYMPCYVETVIV